MLQVHPTLIGLKLKWVYAVENSCNTDSKDQKLTIKIKLLRLPDFSFSSTAQSRALWAGSVNGGCSGLKKYKSDFPSKFTVSSRTLKSVIPFALKNLAPRLVPARKRKTCSQLSKVKEYFESGMAYTGKWMMRHHVTARRCHTSNYLHLKNLPTRNSSG